MDKDRRDWYAVQCDGFDVSRFGRIRERSRRLAELSERGLRDGGPTFGPLVQDLYNVLYKINPVQNKALSGEFAVNGMVVEEMQKTSEYTSLHGTTQLNILASAVAVNALGDAAIEILVKYRQKVKDLQDQQSKLPPRSNQSPEQQAQQQALDSALGVARDEMRQMIRTALEKAREEAEDVESSLAAAWGEGTCDASETDIGDKLELAEELARDAHFKEVAKMLGRIRIMAKRAQRQRTEHDAAEIGEIELGRDLGRLLPTELAKLRHPLLVKDFRRRFAEGGLMQYKLVENQQKERGPIVACVDESGSMTGEPDQWAKAVLLALAMIARQQRRSFAVVHFSDPAEWRQQWYLKESRVHKLDPLKGAGIASRAFPKGKMTPQDVLVMAQHFYGGGTDFVGPLLAGIEHLKNSEFSRGDLIFITDGYCSISPSMMADLIKVKEAKQFKAIGVLVGAGQWMGSTGQFFDATSRVDFGRRHRNDSEALELMFSV